MESANRASPKYHLGKITSKYLILEITFSAFSRQKGFKYLQQINKKFKQLLSENFKAALSMSRDSLSNIKDLPFTLSEIDSPEKYT
jgi:hypothetical protein